MCFFLSSIYLSLAVLVCLAEHVRVLSKWRRLNNQQNIYGLDIRGEQKAVSRSFLDVHVLRQPFRNAQTDWCVVTDAREEEKRR